MISGFSYIFNMYKNKNQYDKNTKWKTHLEYYFDTNNIPKSILSSTLYNLAFISQKLGVIKEYKVIAKLTIKIQKNGEIERL